jgi:choline-phosphate cytidylyltransferase
MADDNPRGQKRPRVVSAKDADSGGGAHFSAQVGGEGRRDGTDPANPARVYMDGIFDCFHYGHARALQQGKKSFEHVTLVVGVCNDEITHRLKGRTVMTEFERAESLRHCKWVDEVVENAPWLVTQEFIDEHDIDYIAHGEDISLDADGNDVYAFAKSQGRFTTINRTEGISTSDLILRIIRDYDAYLLRNLKRGYSHDDLNIGVVHERKVLIADKLRSSFGELKDNVKGFLQRFGPIPSWLQLGDGGGAAASSDSGEGDDVAAANSE